MACLKFITINFLTPLHFLSYYKLGGIIMLINSILLAISSSLDSLGIGVTYGIKKTKISNISKFILFAISCLISFASILLGDFLTNIFSVFISNLISGCVLIFIGFTMILKSIFDSKNFENNYYDFNNSNLIDPKEAVALGLALSLDSFGIGVSYSLTTSNCFIFPFLIGIFQIIFLSLGSFLGKKINNISNLPDFICSIVSGILLILFGIFRLY